MSTTFDSFEDLPPDIDKDVFSVARLYDFLLGGRHNFAADRDLGRKLLAAEPNGRLILLENRAFLARTMRFLLERGVRQFLDLGSGIPTQGYVHELAAEYPDAKVVYVDNDAPAVSHSNYILRDHPGAGALLADMRDPERILGDPSVKQLIDLTKPVALLALAVIHFIPVEDGAEDIVTRYRNAMAPGSYLVITHATADDMPETVGGVQEIYQENMTSATPRTRTQVTGLFDGFEILDPGVVYMPLWRPEPGAVVENAEETWFYGGVGHLV